MRFLVLLLVAGCAATPSEELVWSAPLAQKLRAHFGETVEVATFSRLRPGTIGQPWEPFLVDGVVAVAADAEEGGSGLYRKIRLDPRRHPVIEFRRRMPARDAAESPLHAAAKLDFEDRAKLRLAKMLTVHGLPYASLIYVWKLGDPAETVLRSPHTDRVRYVVAAVGLMTDPGDDGSRRRGYYADITFRSVP
jgi:hypothetical protein